MRRLVLSVDAGGIRALEAASLFLGEIEDAFGKPAGEVFDLSVGTSGGSLVATGVASGMTAKEMWRLGRGEGSGAFTASLGHRLKTLGGYKGPKYDIRKLNELVLRVFGPTNIGGITKRLIVTVTDTVDHRALFVKSHRGDYRDWPLATALTASCAAPFYFAPVFGRYADGGLHSYSPVLSAFGEAKALWPTDPITIISIGSGQPSPGQPDSGNPLTVAKSLVGSVTASASDGDHWLLGQWIKDTGSHDRLIRLDPKVTVPMDATDTKTLDKVQAAAIRESAQNSAWRDFIEPWGYA